MKIKEELIVEDFIPERKAIEYTSGRKGYDVLKLRSKILNVKFNYKWFFIPIMFCILFIVCVLLGNAGIAILLFFNIIFSLGAVVVWRDYKEDKEEKKYDPKPYVDLLLYLKKPYKESYKIGEKLKINLEIMKWIQ